MTFNAIAGQYGRWNSVVILALAGWAATAAMAQPAAPRTGADWPDAIKVSVTAQDFREIGLAVLNPDGDLGFANKCHGLLTVSDKLLAQFTARGFSLTTLCLGLASYHWQYHPETGKPLTVAMADTIGPLLLDIPNCFKNGTPYLDCTFNVDPDGNHDGPKINSAERRAWWAARGQWIDGMMKKLLASGKYQRACTCADFENSTETVYTGKKTPRSAPLFGVRVAAYCYVEALPPCASVISSGAVRSGFLFSDMDASVLGQLGFYDSYKELLNEQFEISPTLPRGYAHRVATPEGTDPEPFVPLPAGKKITVGSGK